MHGLVACITWFQFCSQNINFSLHRFQEVNQILAIERQIFNTQLALEVDITFKYSFFISNTDELDVLESVVSEL